MNENLLHMLIAAQASDFARTIAQDNAEAEGRPRHSVTAAEVTRHIPDAVKLLAKRAEIVKVVLSGAP